MLASYLYIKNSPMPASAGDGAILGALAGVVGGLIVIVIGIPVHLLVGTAINEIILGFVKNANPQQAEMMRQQMIAGSTVAGTIINQFVLAVIIIVVSVLGGLLGIPIFEKRKGNQIPPPPPSGMGGGYAA
jgi:CDP-diglyceride synthetase